MQETPHPLPSPQLTDFQTLHRMLGWGIVMAMLWGLLPLLCGSWLGMLFLFSPEDDLSAPKTQSQIEMEDGFGSVLFWGFFVLMFYWGCVWTVAGGVAGILAGFYAPARDSRWPWCSKFFWQMGTQIFCRWFITNFILLTCGPVLWNIVFPRKFVDWRISLIVTCLMLVLGFAACARASVNLLLWNSKQ